MELSELQKTIIEANDDKMVVISRAATGKTRCLTERVRHWLNSGVEPAKICCITFTNLAENEMQVRLGDDYKDGMFIGTIHALAARFLLMGGHGAEVGKAIDEEKFNDFFEVKVRGDGNCFFRCLSNHIEKTKNNYPYYRKIVP